MALMDNVPTFGYIHWKNLIVIKNGEMYGIKNSSTVKKYVYWDISNPYQLVDSNIRLESSGLKHLLFINDNGVSTQVPLDDTISLSWDGDSEQLIRDKIYGLYETVENFGNRFASVEISINEISSIIGESENDEGSIRQQISQIKQKTNEIDLSVKNVNKQFSDNLEINKLREDLNKSMIDFNSALGIFKSQLNSFFRDNVITSDEKIKINEHLNVLISRKDNIIKYVDTVISKVPENSSAIEVEKTKFINSIDNLKNYITTAISDGNIVPSEMVAITSLFGGCTVALNSLKDTLDSVILLGFGGSLVEEISRINMKSDEISLTVSQTQSDNEKKFSEIKMTTDDIRFTVSKKVGVEEVKSTIRQSSNDIQIGFNGINDRININSQYMAFTAVNGNKDMLLYGGQVCVYNNINDTFMGTMGSVLRNSASGFLGTGFILSRHCNAFTISRDGDWDEILTNRSPNPTHWFLMDFNSNEIKIGMNMLTSHVNLRGHNLLDVFQGNIKSVYCNGIYDYTTRKSFFKSTGDSIINDMDWSWNGKELMNPKLYNDNFYYTNGYLAFAKNPYNNNMMNGTNWDWQGYNIVNAHIYAGYALPTQEVSNKKDGKSMTLGATTKSIEGDLLQEDFAKYDKEKNKVMVNLNDGFKTVYGKSKRLETENEQLKLENKNLKEKLTETSKELSITKNALDTLLMI